MSEDQFYKTRTDALVPVREANQIPVISAEQYGHMGKYAGALVQSAFEMIGGLPRLAKWADHNPTDFYTKIWVKTVQRSQQVEHSGTVSLDEALDRLDRQNSREEIIDAEWTPLDL